MKSKLTGKFESESNKSYTENGAETYRSTTNDVLDFFYLAPARQGMDNLSLFELAFKENPVLALKAAFYVRDVRQGKGQRQTFRDILAYLYVYERNLFDVLVPFVPEYGRWDDLIGFTDSPAVAGLVYQQLKMDMNSEHPSLLGKWMPSENTSSRRSRGLAKEWMRNLGIPARGYRHMLSELRKRIGVVECQMSDNAWDGIKYSAIPSRAMKIYRNAFLRHDPKRFSSFVDKAMNGEAVIHSSGVYPHEIVHEFLHATRKDNALEAMWRQLPDYFSGEERKVLPIVDVSGSMTATIKNSSVSALDVSIGLGLYCAERNTGPFQNMLMTFSTHPLMVKISGKTLREKILRVNDLNWDMSTNLQEAFSYLLSMAKQIGASPEDMPSNLLIISDMEFDRCINGTNLDGIRAKYAAAGYEMPLVTFWNVMGRNKQAPATKDETNVFLVSGFSAETVGKVLNAEAVTPEGLMLEVLGSERYSFIDKILKGE